MNVCLCLSLVSRRSVSSALKLANDWSKSINKQRNYHMHLVPNSKIQFKNINKAQINVNTSKCMLATQ